MGYTYELSRVVYGGFLLDLFYYGAFWVGGGVYAGYVHGGGREGVCFVFAEDRRRYGIQSSLFYFIFEISRSRAENAALR